MKKNLVLLFAMIVIIVSCSKNKEDVLIVSEESIELRSSTHVAEGDFPALFSSAYPDINFSEYWTETISGETRYLGKGIDSNGNTTEAMISGDTKESCSGVGCSYCKIDTLNGGCKCERKATSTGYCNHTVSSFILSEFSGSN